MLAPQQQRRFCALVGAVVPASASRARPEEDPRVAHARTLTAPDDPQATRADIVLPSGLTRPEIAVQHGWQLSLELNYRRKITAGSEASLTAAVAGGADLRVATNFPHSEHIDPTEKFGDLIGEVATFPVTYLLRPAGDAPWVAGVMTNRQPIECPDGFGPRSSLSLFLYNQDGHQAIARPHLDGIPATVFPPHSLCFQQENRFCP